MLRSIRQVFFSGVTISVATLVLQTCYAQDIVSTTTVSPFYTPRATSGVPVNPPLDAASAQSILQTQMLQGTPGAVTIPSTGVVIPQGGTVVSQPIQPIVTQPVTVQRTVMQPEVDYEWTFSRIKNVGYHVTKRINPITGSVTTSYQPEETSSLLPWLHQREVVRYKPVTVNVPVSVVSPVVSGYSIPTSSSVIPTTVIRDVADTPPTLSTITSSNVSVPTSQVTSYPIQQTGVQATGSATIYPPTEVRRVVEQTPESMITPQNMQESAPLSPTSVANPLLSPQMTESQNVKRPVSADENKEDQQKADTLQPSTRPTPRVSPYGNPLTKENSKINLSPKMLN